MFRKMWGYSYPSMEVLSLETRILFHGVCGVLDKVIPYLSPNSGYLAFKEYKVKDSHRLHVWNCYLETCRTWWTHSFIISVPSFALTDSCISPFTPIRGKAKHNFLMTATPILDATKTLLEQNPYISGRNWEPSIYLSQFDFQVTVHRDKSL